jgi:uncharacterized protein YlxW (UPF0749 family)
LILYDNERETWSKSTSAQEARRRAEILDANKDIEETNRALEDLRNFTRLMNNSASQRKPKLEDYYQLSDKMKTYAVMTMGVLGVGSAYAWTDTNTLNFRNPKWVSENSMLLKGNNLFL